VVIVERMNGRSTLRRYSRVWAGHETANGRRHGGIQIHSDERNGEADVPVIGDAIIRKHRGGMRRGFKREGRFDDIALEGRVQTVAAVEGSRAETGQSCRVVEVAAILMPQIELDGAVVEILPFERVIRRVLIVESHA